MTSMYYNELGVNPAGSLHLFVSFKNFRNLWDGPSLALACVKSMKTVSSSDDMHL